MKKESLNKSLEDIRQLGQLARQIRQLYESTEQLAQLARTKCNEAVAEALLLGKALNDAKKIVGHGQWLKWLEKHCPRITDRTARKYMALSNRNHGSDLENVTSLRQAYIAAGIIDLSKAKAALESEQKPAVEAPKALPAPESPAPTTQYQPATRNEPAPLPVPAVQTTEQPTPPPQPGPARAPESQPARIIQPNFDPDPVDEVRSMVAFLVDMLETLPFEDQYRAAFEIEPVALFWTRKFPPYPGEDLRYIPFRDRWNENSA